MAAPAPAEAKPVAEDRIREERAPTRDFEERFAAELARVNRSAGSCFQSAPEASGQIAFVLVLDEQGTSVETRVSSSDLPEAVTACLLEAMRAMRDVGTPAGRIELPLPPFEFERGRDVTPWM